MRLVIIYNFIIINSLMISFAYIRIKSFTRLTAIDTLCKEFKGNRKNYQEQKFWKCSLKCTRNNTKNKPRKKAITISTSENFTTKKISIILKNKNTIKRNYSIYPYSKFVMETVLENNVSCEDFLCRKKLKLTDEMLEYRKNNFTRIKCPTVTYYLSEQEIFLFDAVPVCANAGLCGGEVLKIEEYYCLYNFFHNHKGMSMFTTVADPFFNRTFITCPGYIKPPKTFWAPNEPNNYLTLEACCVLKFCKNCKDIGYRDVPCINKYRLLCQDPTSVIKFGKKEIKEASDNNKYYNWGIIKVLSGMKIYGCVTNSCTNYRMGINNLNLGKKFTKIPCKDKTYYVSRNMYPFVKNITFCCQNGLFMGEILTVSHLNCLADFYVNRTIDLYLFTSVWDVFMNRTFLTCPGYKTIPKRLWAKNEPNNESKLQLCTAVNVCKRCKNFGLNDVFCTESLPILCQDVPFNSEEGILDTDDY